MNAKLQKILDDLRTAQISSEDAIRQAYSLGCKDAVKDIGAKRNIGLHPEDDIG